MEGTLFPNRPAFPAQPTKPATHHRLKFNTSSLPLPPLQQQQPSSSTSSHSFPLDSLLQHLLHVSHPVKSSLASPHVVSSRNQDSPSAQFGKHGGGSSIAIPMVCEGSVNDGARVARFPPAQQQADIYCKARRFSDAIEFVATVREEDAEQPLQGLASFSSWGNKIWSFEDARVGILFV